MSALSPTLALLGAVLVGAGWWSQGHAGPALADRLAMQSPWWEDYEQKDRFLCDHNLSVVLERNDSQASLMAAGRRSILFREASQDPGLRYRNGAMLIVLRGDELMLEHLPQRLSCVRTEQV